MSDAWDPQRYERFKQQRARPFYDLVSLVHKRAGMRVIDLGCGTGELTRELHDHLAASSTLGVDRSPNMLDKSASHATSELRFEQGDLRDSAADGNFDLIFSNAALHWVDDHDTVLEKLAARLAPAGQLAIQVPANHGELPHLMATQIAREEPFATLLDGYVRASPVLEPQDYARLLHRIGFAHQRVQLVVYPHLLECRDDVVVWMKGTALTAYEERLAATDYARFVDRYQEELLAALPDERPFFYPFRRILLWGRVSA